MQGDLQDLFDKLLFNMYFFDKNLKQVKRLKS